MSSLLRNISITLQELSTTTFQAFSRLSSLPLFCVFSRKALPAPRVTEQKTPEEIQKYLCERAQIVICSVGAAIATQNREQLIENVTALTTLFWRTIKKTSGESITHLTEAQVLEILRQANSDLIASFESRFPPPAHNPVEASVGTYLSENLVRARENTENDLPFLTAVLKKALDAAGNDREKLLQQIKESDPEICLLLPRLALKEFLDSPPEKTPRFMLPHLEALRQSQSEVVFNQIATALVRETDFLACMQAAFQSFSS